MNNDDDQKIIKPGDDDLNTNQKEEEGMSGMDTPDKIADADEYYSLNLTRGDLTNDDKDDFIDHPTDLGGVLNENQVSDQSTVGSTVGMPGHPGIDDGTD